MLKKQRFYPRATRPEQIQTIAALGLGRPDDLQYRQRGNWSKSKIYRDNTFLLQAVESCREEDYIGCIRQENYIKVNFWLEGKHTTVLDGFGEHEHERPQVLITSGPPDMVKMDLMSAGRSSWVALCLQRDFFETQMALEPSTLPGKLRDMVLPEPLPFSAHAIPLTPDLTLAARSVLESHNSVWSNPMYGQSKAIELMCLLISRMADESSVDVVSQTRRSRQVDRIQAARDLLAGRYTEPLTLNDIAKAVGISKTALTVGFRNLFGESIFEYLQKERMQHAYDLLQDGGVTVEQVAQAVGYSHACNFSTAFRTHFGYSPTAVRCRI